MGSDTLLLTLSPARASDRVRRGGYRTLTVAVDIYRLNVTDLTFSSQNFWHYCPDSSAKKVTTGIEEISLLLEPRKVKP